MAVRLTAEPHRPRLHGAAFGQSEPRRRARQASSIGSVYARYNATVPSAVTMGTPPVHAMAARDAATISQMEAAGVPCRGLTQCTSGANGVPRSRASDHSAREAEVMQASPQNHIAMDANAAMALPTRAPSAPRMIAI